MLDDVQPLFTLSTGKLTQVVANWANQWQS